MLKPKNDSCPLRKFHSFKMFYLIYKDRSNIIPLLTLYAIIRYELKDFRGIEIYEKYYFKKASYFGKCKLYLRVSQHFQLKDYKD